MNSNKNTVLFVISLSSFVTAFLGSSLNVALPAIGKEFSMNPVALGWIAASFLLANGMCVLPAGRIADLAGRKNIFITGIAVNGLASLLCALSPDETILIVFRALQGAGCAMIFSTTSAILTEVFPPQERGHAFGISIASVYAGLSAGPFIGGVLTQLLGWRSIFYFAVTLSLMLIALTLRCIRGNTAEARGEKFDYAGSALYGCSLFCLIFGLTIVPSPYAALFLAGGIFAGALFIFSQMKTAYPILRLSLFRHNRLFLFSNTAAMINYSATAAIGFLLSLYLQYVKGLSPSAAGLVLIWQPAVQSLLSPLTGRLSDRIEPRILASSGMGIIAIVLMLLAFTTPATPVPAIVAYLVLLGVGFALFSSPNTNAIMGSVGKKDLGTASAVVSTVRILGQIFSMGITMLLFALIIGRAKIDPAHTAGFISAMKTGFIIFACLCAAGVFASLARGTAHE